MFKTFRTGAKIEATADIYSHHTGKLWIEKGTQAWVERTHEIHGPLVNLCGGIKVIYLASTLGKYDISRMFVEVPAETPLQVEIRKTREQLAALEAQL